MRKFLLIILITAGIGGASAQCPLPGSTWGTGNAPAPGSNVNITTCAYGGVGGDYATVNACQSGVSYTVTYTGNETYVTVYDNTYTAVAWGASPLTFAATYNGTYYSHSSFDATCSVPTTSTCLTVNWAGIAACPQVTALTMTGGDLTSADINWTPGGSETSWNIEWGAPGFTPGTGTQIGSAVVGPTTGYSITGLTANTIYDVYVQADCGGTTAIWILVQVNTYDQPVFMEWNTACSPLGFVDISGFGTDLGLTDDSEIGITPLPFPLLFQGQPMTSMTVGNNGGLQLGSTTANIGYGGDFTTLANGTMFPWGDDLDDESGNVYAAVIGTSPNQTMIIQWDNSNNWPGSGLGDPSVTFQIQIDEATGEIYYVYDDVIFGGGNAGDDYGANADIGISGANQDYTVSTNNPQYLMDNSCVHFFYSDCPNPMNYTVVYTTASEGSISWSSGLFGETNWTVIYGPEGFDPLSSGTTVNTTSSSLTIPGLNDATIYDVYIYADCNPGVLQSSGAFGQFATLPNCSDVTALAASTAIDSIFTSWNWTESSGIGTYPSTGFNLQYGMLGFQLYDGTETIVNADNNYTDTTADVNLLAGGVYEMYVQSVCNTDTSYWVGPITFTMPLTNDMVCTPENLTVDGTVYTFDNTGATTEANESTIAPPATGAQTSDGWDNSSVTYTTWFTFTAPASGNMSLSGVDAGFDGQFAVYEATNCANFTTFTLVGANDDALDGSSLAPDFSICGLTPGNTYYLMHDSWSTSTTGIYTIALDEITVEAGASTGVINACSGDVVDLFSGISGYDMGGTWMEAIPTISFADPMFPTAGLAYQLFDFEYQVVDGCAMDSVDVQVQVYGPSSAGIDGSIDACKNEPINLLAGLNGNVDLGGTWYNPSNNVTPSAIVASSIAGQYNYDYITGNGVCPDDTANVIVNVLGSCDYLNVDEMVFGGMDLYPNPTTGSVFVTNYGSSDVFGYQLTDLNGKVIVAENAAINGTESTEVNLTKLETGMYLIRVFNDNADKTFRIIKE